MKIEHILNKVKVKLKTSIISKLTPTLDSASDYWKHLSEREQWIIKIGGVLVAFALLFFIIGTAMDIEDNLGNDIVVNDVALANARVLASQLKDLSQITPNDFTSVNTDRIKGDIIQLFDIKNPDVALIDKTLTIKMPDVKFDLVMLFLDQLRKSYGIYPSKLKITRSSTPGFVSFSATFDIEE